MERKSVQNKALDQQMTKNGVKEQHGYKCHVKANRIKKAGVITRLSLHVQNNGKIKYKADVITLEVFRSPGLILKVATFTCLKFFENRANGTTFFVVRKKVLFSVKLRET